MSYIEITDKEYHSTSYLSQSKLKSFIDPSKSLARAAFEMNEEKSSKSMSLGTLIHDVLLNDRQIDMTKVVDKIDGRTKEGKEQAKLLESGEYLLKSDVDIVLAIKANFEQSEGVKLKQRSERIEQAGIVDVSLGEYMQTMKFKPDMVLADGIVDIKSIGEPVTSNSTRRAIYSNYYCCQLATYMHLDGLITNKTKDSAYIIWCETVAPYGVHVQEITLNQLQKGFEQFAIAFERFNRWEAGSLEGMNMNNSVFRDIYLYS